MNIRDEMIKAGWKTNGIYWWFEDSGQMDFQDARNLHLSSTKGEPEIPMVQLSIIHFIGMRIFKSIFVRKKNEH